MDHEYDFPFAPQVVLEELTSPDFLAAFASEVGVEMDQITCGNDGTAATADMQWRFSTRNPGIPALAQKLLPGEVRLQWTQGWGPLTATGAQGTLTVALLGSPKATTSGTTHLRTADSGSSLTTTTRTKASLPFPLAGRVQSMIDKDLVGWILGIQARVLNRRNGV